MKKNWAFFSQKKKKKSLHTCQRWWNQVFLLNETFQQMHELERTQEQTFTICIVVLWNDQAFQKSPIKVLASIKLFGNLPYRATTKKIIFTLQAQFFGLIFYLLQ